MGEQVSRRRAMKKAAVVVGGALWATPVIQTVDLKSAWAFAVISICGDAVCNYEVAFHIDEAGGVTIAPGGFECSAGGNWGDGPDIFDVAPDGTGGWIVTVGDLDLDFRHYPAENTQITFGVALADGQCVPGTNTAIPNAMAFAGPNVSDIAIHFCVARGPG